MAGTMSRVYTCGCWFIWFVNWDRGRSKGTAGAWQPVRGKRDRARASPARPDPLPELWSSRCRRTSGKICEKNVFMSAWIAPKSLFQAPFLAWVQAWEGTWVNLSGLQSCKPSLAEQGVCVAAEEHLQHGRALQWKAVMVKRSE